MTTYDGYYIREVGKDCYRLAVIVGNINGSLVFECFGEVYYDWWTASNALGCFIEKQRKSYA